MENRIEINGVWYVREDSIAEDEIKDLDIIEFQGCSYETDKYCLPKKTELNRIMLESSIDILSKSIDILKKNIDKDEPDKYIYVIRLVDIDKLYQFDKC
jgi:hypothetical protein